MVSSSAAVIRAEDFSERTTDPVRRDWTMGKMRHVIAALDGSPVCITTDRSSGHTLINVRLVRVYQESPGGKVLYAYTLSDGKVQETATWLFKIGEAILPLDGKRDAKWQALTSYREERAAAIKWAREHHGECEGREYGRWEATPHGRHVAVTYTPMPNPMPGKTPGDRWYGNVQLSEITPA